jgi:hypothetical protein
VMGNIHERKISAARGTRRTKATVTLQAAEMVSSGIKLEDYNPTSGMLVS